MTWEVVMAWVVLVALGGAVGWFLGGKYKGDE